MRAWTFHRRGNALQVLKLSTLPVPTEVEPTEFLVKGSHAALNPFGYTMVWLVPGIMRKKPAIPEFDFSGRIAMGASKARLDWRRSVRRGGSALWYQAWQRITLRRPHYRQQQSCFEAKECIFRGCSSLALVGVTAVLAMGKSGLEAGDSVFVNGGRGGAGLIMIQMAKELVGPNGKVVATCSGTNAGLVKSAGAGMARTWISHWQTFGSNLR